ncbi:2-hydroxyacid dehydrogenase [Actinobaculum sp. 352]|uniref:2-hydroxyacid dehydrogenase n=1 Tax=Actinobaculum sp. 352 TaxID=2490946 RepID=UPI000F7F77CB|nr:2-hydroxyacid dehydrogenase [Actinobaculum sp. 352]RTE50271.1 hydroxyacid dehydrogenase [Actinobaculum sp. 352]
MKVLVAADRFMTAPVMTDALRKHLPDAEIASVANDFPYTPLASIGDVDEAVGDEEELIAALTGVEVCFTHTYPFTRRVLEACPQLRMVTVCRGGPVNVNLPAAADRGVVVTNTPGRNAAATAEHTVAMIMAAVRQIPQRHNELAAGQWRGDYYDYEKVPLQIDGAVVALVGYGAVGSRVAAVLRAFGAHVRVYDPFLASHLLPDGIEHAVSLEAALRDANIVTLHARLTAENRGMLGAEQLALLSPGAVVVNCARGALLDADALCDALESGYLGGAALDVFPIEPLPADHRLLRAPHVVLTPHIAGASRGSAEVAARTGAEDIARYTRGEKVLHAVI